VNLFLTKEVLYLLSYVGPTLTERFIESEHLSISPVEPQSLPVTGT
jgi:hypothetical protein